MGMYINPSGMSKEDWLLNNAIPVKLQELSNFDWKSDKVPVALLDNGMFTAAGVCFNKEEFEVFSNPDGRRKLWFTVSKEKLRQVSPDDYDNYFHNEG